MGDKKKSNHRNEAVRSYAANALVNAQRKYFECSSCGKRTNLNQTECCKTFVCDSVECKDKILHSCGESCPTYITPDLTGTLKLSNSEIDTEKITGDIIVWFLKRNRLD